MSGQASPVPREIHLQDQAPPSTPTLEAAWWSAMHLGDVVRGYLLSLLLGGFVLYAVMRSLPFEARDLNAVSSLWVLVVGCAVSCLPFWSTGARISRAVRAALPPRRSVYAHTIVVTRAARTPWRARAHLGILLSPLVVLGLVHALEGTTAHHWALIAAMLLYPLLFICVLESVVAAVIALTMSLDLRLLSWGERALWIRRPFHTPSRVSQVAGPVMALPAESMFVRSEPAGLEKVRVIGLGARATANLAHELEAAIDRVSALPRGGYRGLAEGQR